MSDDEQRTEHDLDRELIELLNELRVALPGVQVLFAFLLIVPFSNGWDQVTEVQRYVYFVAFLCAAISSAFLIAPSTYHRLRWREGDKEHMLVTANRLAIAGADLPRRGHDGDGLPDHRRPLRQRLGRRGRRGRRRHVRVALVRAGSPQRSWRSRSSSSRILIPYEPMSGISGFSVLRARSTAPGRTAAEPKPAALIEAERVQVVVRGGQPHDPVALLARGSDGRVQQQRPDAGVRRFRVDGDDLAALAVAAVGDVPDDLPFPHGDEAGMARRVHGLVVRHDRFRAPRLDDVPPQRLRVDVGGGADLGHGVSPARIVDSVEKSMFPPETTQTIFPVPARPESAAATPSAPAPSAITRARSASRRIAAGDLVQRGGQRAVDDPR